MIANYHTHTPRCGHAIGSEQAYIRCALDAGLQILGFSDHTPYPFPANHHSSFRMSVAALSDYADTIRALQSRYARHLALHLGVEAEYYPQFFPELVHILQDHGIEYMLLGQHFMGNEIEGWGSIGPTGDRAKLVQYCNQTMQAMQTGLFTYFAHPDLMHFIGDEAFYHSQIRRLCQEANSCGVPLEINLLGYREGRHYPNIRFWEAAAEENCPVILGVDAHQPHNLLNVQAEQEARAMADNLGLTILDQIPLRQICG